MKYLPLFILSLASTVCFAQKPIDKKATKQTKNLLYNLHQVSKEGILFGHQDDLAYGVGWRGTPGRSDVLETTGSYPAVVGWDVGHQLNDVMNIDSVNFDSMKKWMLEVYSMGGINTVSWHMTNYTTGGNSWDKTPSVSDILPNGKHHAELLNQLDLFADFLNDLKVGKNYVPVIFRPWHEHNGSWFWWGKSNCTEEEYVQLFRFTVDYLKNKKNVHHLLYAFSPDRSQLPLDDNAKQHYLYGYPGDDFVDIIGLDNYGDVGRSGPMTEADHKNFLGGLQLITDIAREKGKVAALSETGLESLANETWFTSVVMKPFIENPGSLEIAWVLVWRNANKKHHYAPYKGHVSEQDFQNFYALPTTFFQSDLNNIYRKRRWKK